MSDYLEHVGIVVDRLGDAQRLIGEVLGLELIRERDLHDHHVRAANYRCGEVELELIEATDPLTRARRLGDGPARIEHLAFVVDDLDATVDRLTRSGVEVTDVGYMPESDVSFTNTVPETSDGIMLQFKMKGRAAAVR
jgi:methylmalonyl-CoA/ethylmalonyl-CoA epimerase